MSLSLLAERLRDGDLSPREAVETFLERIEATRSLNIFLSVRAEEALAEADAPVDGPLRGVPVAIKDVIDVGGFPMTAGSEILRHNVAARDAECVARLRAAGAIVLGTLNTHEFAYGASTTSPHFGPARNPWSPDRICGGSSGGSGAAVAAGLAAGALGTDTAGSVRIPACYCGVTGLRPTTGLVSTTGVFPVSSTLDVVGPLAASADDCSVLMQALVPSFRPQPELETSTLRVGVVEDLFELADPAVARCVRSAVDDLRPLVGSVEPVTVPWLDEAGTVLQAILLPEAAEVHLPWLRSRLSEYGPDVRARLLSGLLLTPTAHVTGLRARRHFLDGLLPLFDRFDVLVHPAMPVAPPPIDDHTVDWNGERVPYRLTVIPYNSSWALAGAPAASVPCGFVGGMPMGLAIAGAPGADATVLATCAAFQLATDWHLQRPALATHL